MKIKSLNRDLWGNSMAVSEGTVEFDDQGCATVSDKLGKALCSGAHFCSAEPPAKAAKRAAPPKASKSPSKKAPKSKSALKSIFTSKGTKGK